MSKAFAYGDIKPVAGRKPYEECSKEAGPLRCAGILFRSRLRDGRGACRVFIPASASALTVRGGKLRDVWSRSPSTGLLVWGPAGEQASVPCAQVGQTALVSARPGPGW
jgi:hypothetical protein